MTTQNTILFKRRNKFLIPSKSAGLPNEFVAAFARNCEGLGYIPSLAFLKAFQNLDRDNAKLVHDEVVNILKNTRGVEKYAPMYPNFPQQVMDASVAELYLNATIHYLTAFLSDVTDGNFEIWSPEYAKVKRETLRDKIKLEQFDLGSENDLVEIFTNIVTSNTSISSDDKDALEWFVKNGEVVLDQPIPNKENLAVIAALLIKNKVDFPLSYVKTATDVLRIACAMNGGDVSLSAPTKFLTFKRSERRLLLSMLESCNGSDEDLARWTGRWLRLAEKLHPGEYRKQYPNTWEAFYRLRSGNLDQSFNSKVESAIKSKNTESITKLLSQRPGEFARRLDKIIRDAKNEEKGLIGVRWSHVADKVSTPVLLQVSKHFNNRLGKSTDRVFFPKGNIAKVKSIVNTLPTIPDMNSFYISDTCNDALVRRFSKLPSLGNIYINPELKNYLLPFSQRSASSGLRQLVRGSKVSFEDKKNVVRFFIHWKDGQSRTDLDLSACLYDETWSKTTAITYYNLRDSEFGAYHSGDITSAPNGAAEYIDVDLSKVIKNKMRYVVMMVNSFTGQMFNTIPEISAGWQLRGKSQSGEIFESKTVVDRFAVTSSSKQVMPLIIDAAERRVIWCDAALKSNHLYANNVAANKDSIAIIGKAFTQINKPNCYDLFMLHAGRGTLVDLKEKADTIFDINDGIKPTDLDIIASQFMQ
jgi:hypothetical protein